jgi:hypothetical protein
LGIINSTGYCKSEGRFLTNDEKVSVIFNFINARTTLSNKTENGVKDFIIVPYKSINEFKNKNLQCCEMGTWNVEKLKWPNSNGWRKPNIFMRASGGYGYAVGMIYKVFYRDNNILRDKKINEAYNLTNCGRLSEE